MTAVPIAVDQLVVLHFLPPYCPNHNPIERVWTDLHANVTSNHRCRAMDDLLANVRSFLMTYHQRDTLNPSLRELPPSVSRPAHELRSVILEEQPAIARVHRRLSAELG